MNPNSAINQLPFIRKDKGLWNQFSYLPMKDADGIDFDKHWISRYALIIALQYNWTSSDEELLRFIVKNEVLMHGKLSGLYDSLHRSSYLLAKFKNPANVFLFFEAKEANFDTHCGYHIEYVFSAGIRETIDYVKASDSSQKYLILDRVEGEVVDGYLDETKVQQWFEENSWAYPTALEKESRQTMIDRAIIFGDVESGRKLINEWYRELDSDLYNLSQDAKKLGEYEIAIKAQKKIKQSYTSSRDLISNSQEIAELYRLGGLLEKAWQELKGCKLDLEKYDGWKSSGLGRFVIQTALKISLDSESESLIKKESFYWAHNLIEASKNITLVIFQTACAAATELNDDRLQKHYELLRDQEQQRINEMFRNIRSNNAE